MPTVQTWSGKLDVHQRQRPVSVAQDSLRNWKQLSRVRYHERSALLASRSALVLPKPDDAMESIRYFTEACDQFQGHTVAYDPIARNPLLQGFMLCLISLVHGVAF